MQKNDINAYDKFRKSYFFISDIQNFEFPFNMCLLSDSVVYETIPMLIHSFTLGWFGQAAEEGLWVEDYRYYIDLIIPGASPEQVVSAWSLVPVSQPPCCVI